MAAVYKARDTKRGSDCAIKEMSLSTVTTEEKPQSIQNFLDEATILSRLNHPNLPAFTDFFTEDARHYLVMEYIDGSTLEDLLERQNKPFSERRVLGWARQLCDVLEYLHTRQPPVIFRDMKPGNVMLSRTGSIKLIDFGIARIFKNTGSQDTQLLGTPGFAPPEQYGGAQTDERSDIYSLAMTLYQLMTLSISEKGFGLTDVHTNFPMISPPVARALEKATSLRSEDRYQSVEVFRRALLGIDTFRFEHGGEATTPEELAALCSRYPDEAASYLYDGEIEAWLQDIGATDLARTARRISTTEGDREMGVNRFLQTVMGPNARTRSTQLSQTMTGSRTTRARPGDPPLVVRPKTIDFGPVYPGLSAPMPLTISGTKGALVSGTIHAVESWIVLDTTTFDGITTPVRVRVDTTRLRGSTHFTGTIIIQPEGSEREISVTVSLDVLGSTTGTIASRTGQGASRSGATSPASSASMALQDADDDQGTTLANGKGRLKMANAAASVAGAAPPLTQPYSNARYDEYKAKYGAPGTGWTMLNISPRQQRWMHVAITFAASLMAGTFPYLLLAHIPPLAKTSVLPPSPWFLAVSIGMLLFSTAGALLINLKRAWADHTTLTRAGTAAAISLLLLGVGEGTWQNLSLPGPQVELLLMLMLAAAGATLGVMPRVSDQIIKRSTWLMTRMVWVMYAIAVVVGGGLGYGLSSGISYGCFAPFGALFGAGIGVALVLRVRRLIMNNTPAQTP